MTGDLTGWQAELVDLLAAELPEAIERVVVDRGELTLHAVAAQLLPLAQLLRDDPRTRFEMLASLSGVDYLEHPADDGRRLHSVLHLLSMSYRRRVRVEVSLSVDDPRVPSVTSVWPTADWHERETFDFFGIVYEGHPDLTRIQMPDEWVGHPQRKDYPLGGVPVEYDGATVLPPDERRAWA